MARPIKHRNKWRVRWIDEFGKRHSEVFDHFKDADYKLRKSQTEVEEVNRGLRKPRVIQKTFFELCDYWMEYRAKYKRSWRDDKSIIEKHLKPFFKNIKINEVSLSKIDGFISTKSHLTNKTISNILTLLISLLNTAKDLGWLAVVPKIRKPKVFLREKDFNYLRTNDEILALLREARIEGQMPYMLYLTAIHTGMRAGELAGLKWADIDFKRRLIKVQRSYDGPTKSGEARFVPLLDGLFEELLKWKILRVNDFVFSNNAGTMLGRSCRIFQEIFKRILDKAEFPRIIRNNKERRYIVFHDLRHTFASHWVMNGGDIFKLQRILGHKSIEMTMRYSHLDPRSFMDDLSRFSFSSEGQGEVIELKR